MSRAADTPSGGRAQPEPSPPGHEAEVARPATPEQRTGGWRRRLFALAMNLYPPYLGAGIRVRLAAPGAPISGGGTAGDGAIEVRMGLHFWNRNILGTQFGGSLYSLCDPFYVLILRQKLGPDYVIWDKSAAIRFRRPGRGAVRAVFDVPEAVARDIRARADRGETVEPAFRAEVVDRAGEVVAVVEKLLHVRRRGG